MTFIIYSKTTPSLCDLLRVPYSTSKYGPGFLHYTRLVTPLQPDITRRRRARQLALQIARQKRRRNALFFMKSISMLVFVARDECVAETLQK